MQAMQDLCECCVKPQKLTTRHETCLKMALNVSNAMTNMFRGNMFFFWGGGEVGGGFSVNAASLISKHIPCGKFGTAIGDQSKSPLKNCS